MENKKSIKDYVNQDPGQVQDLIDDIMDNFDFERVHKVMEALNWSWAATNWKIPEINELRAEARRQLRSCTFNISDDKAQEWEYSCGGFEVQCRVWDPEEDEVCLEDYRDDAKHNITLELKFVVDSWGRI